MVKLVAATNNAKKLDEMIRILRPMGFQVLSLSEAGINVSPEETADSFAGNARIKAEAVFALCGLPTVADDSGICVTALSGAPGVHSARYGGEGLTDSQRTGLLLTEMQGVTDRRACFVSAICCILDRDTMLECSGRCEGSLAQTPQGDGGFGYDPIFMVGEKSFSELTGEEKDEISHRGHALHNLRELLRGYVDVKFIV